MSCITTFSGEHFDPVNPGAEKIKIEDIAHALSLITRGNGQVKTFFSVGQHCILCAKEAKARGYENRLVLACLLHDASECYMSDVPRPFKEVLPEYRSWENRLLKVIYEKFLGADLTEEEERLVKQIDDDMLKYDLEYLLNEKQEKLPQLYVELDYAPRSFKSVEDEYLELINGLM